MVLKQVSASQVVNYRRCARYWYNRSILKLPEPSTLPQRRGSGSHKVTEIYLKTGETKRPDDHDSKKYEGVDFDEVFEIVKAGKHNLPTPGTVLVEQKFTFATWPGGPIWLGFIDAVVELDSPKRILDHKTISDFRYCKTPEELLQDTQMMNYARWGIQTYHVPEVVVEHLYLRTKKPYKAHRVAVTAKREHVESIWERDLATVREMCAWAEKQPQTADDLPPNDKACDMYGGCAYRRECGLIPRANLFQKLEKKPMSDVGVNGTAAPKKSLSEMLAAKKAAKQTASPMATGDEGKAQAAAIGHELPVNAGIMTGATGVVPPDAPPNIAVAQKEELPVEEKKKRGRPKKEVVVSGTGPDPMPASEPVQVVQERPESAGGAGVTQGFEIYVDCIPLKGTRVQHTLFEEWIAPYMRQVAEAHGLPDMRLMQFAGWKGPLANIIRENLSTVPSVLVVNSFSTAANEALEVLIPRASRVVRSIR